MLLYNCALTPPGRGSRLSLPGPVSTRRILPVGLTWPVGKPFPPYTQWCCCRSIRPRHWGTCTEGDHDPQVLQELHVATDLTLRATKVTARSVGRAMSTLMVQEHHLWLGLADPDRPLRRRSQELRPAVLSCTEAVWGKQSHPAMAVRCCIHSAAPQPAHRQGQPPAAAPFPRRSSSLHPSGTVEPVVSGVPSPSRSPPRGAAKPGALGRATWRWLRLLFRRRWLHRSFPWRRAG